MKKTALIYHEDYLRHNAGEFHPERKERLVETMNYLREMGILERVELMKPDPCSDEDILRVHTREHLEYIKNLSRSGGGAIDADTYCQSETYEIAKLAVGGDILAGDAVMRGRVNNAYALVRPPGHHATRDRAMGFCYFNNVAIMIRYLQEKFNLRRIFLFDWDAHAANGTMEIFYEDPSILNVSVHQDPRTFYPGTGFMEQRGRGKGEGFTVNIPVPSGTGDADYIYILKEFVIPILERYKPEFIVISAGQDSHRDDPISGLCLTENCYGEMTHLLLEQAERFCNGRLVVELEGGYNLKAFARSNYAIVSSLLGISPDGYEIKEEVRESTKKIVNSLHDLFYESSFIAFEAP